MEITKQNLTLSQIVPKLGMKCIDIGDGIMLPISGQNQQIISFGQIVGYEQNGDPIIKQLQFNGNKTVLSQQTITAKLYDFNSKTLSVLVSKKNNCQSSGSSSSQSSLQSFSSESYSFNNNITDSLIGEYDIVQYSENKYQNIWGKEDYIIQYQNQKWILYKDNQIYSYSIETYDSPQKSVWNNINVQINQNIKSQNICLYKCCIINQNNWIGKQINFPNQNNIVETSHYKSFEIFNIMPEKDKIYCVCNNKIIDIVDVK